LARKRAGLSQAKLAERIGISPGALSRYETGAKPVGEMFLLDACRALEITDRQLLTQNFQEKW
jgi:transcriptional regulator with XRE-family HTH domain